MSLVEHCEVKGVDLDPVRAWMSAVNARCQTQVADVTSLELNGEVFHLDPSRRAEGPGAGGRAWRVEDYRPGVPFMQRLLETCPDGAIKLGPGVEFDRLPSPRNTEIEVINEGGTLVQAVLWAGRLCLCL